MEKISLVARRKSRHFGTPTAAMQRAELRESKVEHQISTMDFPETFWKTEPAVSETYEIDNSSDRIPLTHAVDTPAPPTTINPTTTKRDLSTHDSKDGDTNINGDTGLILETNLNEAISRYCSEHMSANDDRTLEAHISKRTREKTENSASEKVFISVTFLENEQNALLTAREVSDVMKVATGTVIRMARIGKLSGYKIGRSWRFRWDDVLNSFKYFNTTRTGE